MRESVISDFITLLWTLILPSKYKYVVDSIDRMTQIGALKYQSLKTRLFKNHIFIFTEFCRNISSLWVSILYLV